MADIRRATWGDAEAIAQVHVASWRTTYVDIVPSEYLESLDADARAVRWRSLLESDVLCWVAEQHGQIVGFLCGGPIREPLGDFDAELYAVYLLNPVQGQGLGRRMANALAQALHQRGYRSMIVWVLRASSAVNFYEHLGATFLTAKNITIGGSLLPEAAYGWADLARLASDGRAPSVPPG